MAKKIEAAKSASDVLGPDDAGRKKRERDLLRRIHPDVWPSAADVAQQAFAQLQVLLAQEKRKGSSTFEIATRTRTYKVDGLAYTGTVANLYHCTYARDGKLKTGVLKLPRSVRDNDLMVAEAKALKAIRDSGKRRAAYYPRFEESFRHRDAATRVDRRALVLRRVPGFYSLAEVRQAYPSGLDARDLAWMWRRAFAGLSLAHEMDWVHGALGPEHILIHPAEHGLMFCGWTSAVPVGETVKVLGTMRQLTAPEILNKEPVTVTADIYTLSKTMEWMLAPDAPKQFRAFVKGCTFERPGVRPTSVRQLLGELDDLLARLYGPRKFRPFAMPTRGEH